MAQDINNYIVSALKSGFTTRQIAQGLGVEDGAVTQRIDAHGLKELAAENSKFASIDKKYNDLELTVLEKLEKSLKIAPLTPMQSASLLRTLNGAKRRSLAEGQTIINQNNTQLVSLQLPKRHIPQVTRNRKNEIIEVDGRDLVTLPSAQLPSKRPDDAKELPNETIREKHNVADVL